jgi:8-oxo-dGTP pyrophosphatase MutT (NUDIX family)
MERSVSLVRVKCGNEVLQLLRAPSKGREQSWDLPGGHAEGQETPARTAARELKEETGISVQPSTLQMVRAFMRSDGKSFYVFELRTISRPPVRISNEHTDYRWTEDNDGLYGRS